MVDQVDIGKEFSVKAGHPITLHLGRMPENFKLDPKNTGRKDIEFMKERDLIIKKLKTNDGKEVQYTVEDNDDVRENLSGEKIHSHYTGQAVKQSSAQLIFYKNGDDVVLCPISEWISFKKEVKAKPRNRPLEGAPKKKRGREKQILNKFNAAAEEKEKKKRKKKRGDSDDESDNSKSWSEDEFGVVHKSKEQKSSMQINNLDEEKLQQNNQKDAGSNKKNQQKEESEEGESDAEFD